MQHNHALKTMCICSEFPPPYGGIALQAMVLADALEQENVFRIDRISTTLPNSSFSNAIGKIKVVRSILRCVYFFAKCLFTFKRVSLVHVLSGSYLNFLLFTTPAVVLAKLYKKPIIVHYHGGAAGNFLTRWGWWARPVLKVADTIIVPSGFLEQVFTEKGLASTVIPNILNLDTFIYKERGLLQPRILMTRHLEPLYNVGCAIKGFAILTKSYPDAVLTIAGSGSERNTLEQLAKKQGCSDNVIFLGAVPSDRINKLYEENDILLNTSNVDNLPLSILEAFACGLLVISTEAGGIPYIVKDKESGLLVELNDYIGVAERISWALEHPEGAKRLIVKARKSIEKFSWGRIKPAIINCYSELIDCQEVKC